MHLETRRAGMGEDGDDDGFADGQMVESGDGTEAVRGNVLLA